MALPTLSIVETLSKAPGTETRACPRCGGIARVYPAPNPLIALGDILGLERYTCVRCRRTFWRRAAALPDFARVEPGDSDEPGPEESTTPSESTPPDGTEAAREDTVVPLAALDAEPAPPPPSPGPADLATLDAHLARLRRKRKKR